MARGVSGRASCLSIDRSLESRTMTEAAHPDRLAKVDALRADGADPYPPRGIQARPIADLLAEAGTSEAPGPLVGEKVTIAGRITGLRDFGKLIFALGVVAISLGLSLGIGRLVEAVSSTFGSKE